MKILQILSIACVIFHARATLLSSTIDRKEVQVALQLLKGKMNEIATAIKKYRGQDTEVDKVIEDVNKAKEIVSYYKCDKVQIYNITPDKKVTTDKKAHTLEMIRSTNTDSRDAVPQDMLKIDDNFIYPLPKEDQPFVHTDFGAILFKNITAPDLTAIGIILPRELHDEYLNTLEFALDVKAWEASDKFVLNKGRIRNTANTVVGGATSAYNLASKVPGAQMVKNHGANVALRTASGALGPVGPVALIAAKHAAPIVKKRGAKMLKDMKGKGPEGMEYVYQRLEKASLALARNLDKTSRDKKSDGIKNEVIVGKDIVVFRPGIPDDEEEVKESEVDKERESSASSADPVKAKKNSFSFFGRSSRSKRSKKDATAAAVEGKNEDVRASQEASVSNKGGIESDKSAESDGDSKIGAESVESDVEAEKPKVKGSKKKSEEKIEVSEESETELKGKKEKGRKKATVQGKSEESEAGSFEFDVEIEKPKAESNVEVETPRLISNKKKLGESSEGSEESETELKGKKMKGGKETAKDDSGGSESENEIEIPEVKGSKKKSGIKIEGSETKPKEKKEKGGKNTAKDDSEESEAESEIKIEVPKVNGSKKKSGIKIEESEIEPKGKKIAKDESEESEAETVKPKVSQTEPKGKKDKGGKKAVKDESEESEATSKTESEKPKVKAAGLSFKRSKSSSLSGKFLRSGRIQHPDEVKEDVKETIAARDNRDAVSKEGSGKTKKSNSFLNRFSLK